MYISWCHYFSIEGHIYCQNVFYNFHRTTGIILTEEYPQRTVFSLLIILLYKASSVKVDTWFYKQVMLNKWYNKYNWEFWGIYIRWKWAI